MIPSKPTKIPIALTTMSPMSSHNTLHSRRGQMCTHTKPVSLPYSST